MKGLSVKGVAVGAIVALSTSIVLSILMPLVFIDSVRTGKMDVLITSTGPQLYTLGTLLISGMFGIYIGAVVAGRSTWHNATAVTAVTALLVYLVNRPAAGLPKDYPDWFIVASYVLLLPALVGGYYLSKGTNKRDWRE